MSKIRIHLPTYNESENIVSLIEDIFSSVPSVEVMVVDDNSPDGTANLVESLLPKFPNLQLYRRSGKEGLGKAYVDAFQKTLADTSITHVMMMDADFSHNPQYLPEMFSMISWYDIVVGSRYAPGGGTEGWETWRKWLSRLGNLYCRMITGMPLRDCTGGFNIIKADILRRVDFKTIDLSGYAFIMELKYALFCVGAQFYEFPIIFNNRRGGESKLSNHIVREGIIAPWKMICRRKK